MRKMFGCALAVVTIAAGLVVGTTPASAITETYWMPAAGDLTFHGRGFGHGRGMSQYGAQGAALAGRSATQILDFYYPGTQAAQATGIVRVHLAADTTAGLQVGAVPGLRVRNLVTNAVHELGQPAGISQWRLDPDGENGTRLFYFNNTQWIAWGGAPFAGMARFEGPPIIPLVLPNGTRVSYRGVLRTADRTGADLDTINDIGLEWYLRGVVPREAFTTWRPAALQSQAVAARTFAVFHRARSGARDYDLCDTTMCQVYGGYPAEVASTNAAIAATAGVIRTYNAKPIIAEFSSSNGGWTAAGPLPYQVAKADPYDGHAGNPHSTWTLPVNRARAEAELGVGTLRRIAVTARTGNGPMGGRVVSVNAIGSAGTKTFTGNEMRSKLRLKSDWFAPAQSQIIIRWGRIGANSSPVGSIVGDEYVVRGGAGHTFTKGRIYRSSGGAWEVYGPILARYLAIGGPNHRMLLPVGPPVPGGRPGSTVQPYTWGRFLHSTATGARDVSGPIYYAYYRVGFERGRLGLPISYEVAWSGGTRQGFQGGYIYWYRATNTTRVIYI